MRKLFILDHVYYLTRTEFNQIKEMLYFCDDHDGYHIKPDTHEGHMTLGEILTDAIVQGNFREKI